jgi:L-threonylcarbamoyladenylate synthase
MKFSNDISQAVQAVKGGKIIIYPTETFFALGGLGTDFKVAVAVREIKGRPYQKPLPLIAASISQCLEVAEMDNMSLALAEQFWPGPMSILLRAKEVLPLGVKGSDNMVSIRVTPHQDASRLCQMSGSPLIATSANLSGKDSCSRVEDIDKGLIARVSLVYNSDQAPRGDLPSTLVKIAGPRKLKIIRPGQISIDEIVRKGFEVIS